MSDRNIIEAVRQLTGTQLEDRVTIISVTVVSVNINARTFDAVTIGGTAVTDLLGIQLMAGVSDGLLLIPTIGSIVICGYSKINKPFAILYSDITEIVAITGSSVIDMKNGLMQLNDGSYGGMVQIVALTTKLNNLEKAVNKLIIAVTALGAPAQTPLIVTLRANIENTTITHGK